AERMTMTGSKTETVAHLGADIENVVAGRVTGIEKHPDADKLFVCTVDAGQEAPVTIVTGAPNVTAGAVVPVALNGSVLPGGKTIKAGKLRGVLSEGMLCSHQELGLTLADEPLACEDGILILSDLDENPGSSPFPVFHAPFVTGAPIQEALGLSDAVLDFEITNNRPDCLSVRGLAREAAASLGMEACFPIPEVKAGHGPAEDEVRVSIEDPALCARYTARMVKNVKVGPSPRWLRRLLRASGLRPINNIVDITNYVLLEYGQPLHAFDFSCVRGGEIVVRRARPGETLETLDGQSRTLTADMLVIADSARPVAVAGVMGGANSEITEHTRTVLFESANFNGPSVRKTAQALNMRTDASGLFEKGLDAAMTLEAANRACELVELLACGEVLDGEVDAYPAPPKPVWLPFEPRRIRAHLGAELSDAEQVKYLQAAGCLVHVRSNPDPRDPGPSEYLEAEIPSWRADLRIWEDLSEEVARLYGYDRIPSTLTVSRSTGRLTAAQKARAAAKTLLRSFGYDEMLTYSFIGQSDYDLIGMPEDHPLRRSLKILNPLGEETSVMRTTALPGLARSLQRNLAARNAEVRLFEVAATYHLSEEGGLPEERDNLLFGGYGDMDFFTLKGHAEALLEGFRVGGVSYTAASRFAFHPGRCAEVTAGGASLGVFGQLHPKVAAALGASVPVFACELRLDAILAQAAPESKYAPLPRFPAVTRDLALLADEGLTHAALLGAIRQYGGKLLADCALFDVYQGGGVPAGKKSMAYALTYRAPDRTLTDEEVDRAVQKLLRQLEKETGIVLRQ
ncbi:MAG: phenylalanine--tRNA ligase subunit beta, partial [Oscillospiraceae bacterium]|nr:phenylalanine--tRNA ligase subunit beta [Oscillospiraceae bacterium]